MKPGYLIGWLGVAFGLMVAPPQLIRILLTGETQAISLWTYLFLVLALTCYLLHAIYIKSKVFIVAQSINLVVNSIILVYLIGNRGCG